MNRKYFFFDIDGTLIWSYGGIQEIPQGVQKELKRLKEQGHKLFICSGRPKAMLDQKWWDGTFDGYVLNKVADDNEIVARLFGASGKNYAMPARLQFFDLFVTEDTKNNFNAIETDTYIGEVKFENTINRASGVANPRQIERVPAGAEFDFKLVYNVENLQDVEIVGKIPENISAERIIRGFDPNGENNEKKERKIKLEKNAHKF